MSTATSTRGPESAGRAGAAAAELAAGLRPIRVAGRSSHFLQRAHARDSGDGSGGGDSESSLLLVRRTGVRPSLLLLPVRLSCGLCGCERCDLVAVREITRTMPVSAPAMF